MKKYSVKLLALLMIVLLSVIGMAGAADTCAHSYTLHGGRICSKCFRVKADAGCSIYYSLINGTKTHRVYCGTAGHGSELIRQENCIYTAGFYSVSDGKAQKVCNLCHDEQWHAKGSVKMGSSNQAIFLDANTHLVDNLECAECGVMYTAKEHDYKLLDKHGVYVCSDCNTDEDGKEHDKNATSWLDCHGCNGCTEPDCDGVYKLHEGRVCDTCYSMKADAGCVLKYVHINDTETHNVVCGTEGHGKDPIRQENCTYTLGYYRKSGDEIQKVCDLCHDNQHLSHINDTITQGPSDTVIPNDTTDLVNDVHCGTCGVMYREKTHEYVMDDIHIVPVCRCYKDANGKAHNKYATSKKECHGCNSCAEPNCYGAYMLHDNRICDTCFSVSKSADCKLYYEYGPAQRTHYIRCSEHPDEGYEREAKCTYAKGYYIRNANDIYEEVCDLCHNNDGQHLDGTITAGDSNTVDTLPDGTHLVNNWKCTTCGDIFTTLAHECKENAAHEVPICEVCYLDDDGRVHNPAAATPEDYEVCAEIIAEQTPEEPVCKHTTLINRYFTWLDAKQHRESSVCKDCGEVLEITSSHSANASWHNGTVCLYCRTDENGVKHNWYSGECTVCPKPIPDGLNPEDGWVYENGEKSDFTGLAEYDGGLFYILNGQWQKELNGLKLIIDEFWYLAGGQVQERHGFAEYDGEWFYLDGGKLDVTASGVYGYDGKTFLVAAGRLVSECTGLAQVPSGEWYYVAEGRVLTEFSGEVEYDGKTFQIVNGKLAA